MTGRRCSVDYDPLAVRGGRVDPIYDRSVSAVAAIDLTITLTVACIDPVVSAFAEEPVPAPAAD